MNLPEAHAFTKCYAGQIWQRAHQNDQLALKLLAACDAFIKDQLNPAKQREFIHVVEQYSLRNLTITEHQDIERKFGGPEGWKEESKIMVPVGTTLQ